MVKKTSEKNKSSEKNSPKDVKKAPKKLDKWMVVSGALALVLIASLIVGFAGGFCITGKVISEKNAGEIVLEFAESQGVNVEVVRIVKEGGVYNVIVDYQGSEMPIYITTDGKNLVSGLISFEEIFAENTDTTNQPAPSEGYSSEDLALLLEFSECLATKGVKIYGANWCGYTNAWVDTLGGYAAVTPIYVECTENDALCREENVPGYPTTKINGEVYSGSRTIDAIASATGCPVPVPSSGSGVNAYDASC